LSVGTGYGSEGRSLEEVHRKRKFTRNLGSCDGSNTSVVGVGADGSLDALGTIHTSRTASLVVMLAFGGALRSKRVQEQRLSKLIAKLKQPPNKSFDYARPQALPPKKRYSNAPQYQGHYKVSNTQPLEPFFGPKLVIRFGLRLSSRFDRLITLHHAHLQS
jgi:hypothetical protein